MALARLGDTEKGAPNPFPQRGTRPALMDLSRAGVSLNTESSLSMSATVKPEINEWSELLTAVESNEGVSKFPMEVLRRLEGRQRVGKHILSSIEDKLRTLGLGHLPTELPNRQQQTVLLYRVGTPASALIQAIQAGLNESPSNQVYELLHRVNTLPDPDDVVSKEEIASTAAEDLLPAVLKLLQKSGMATTTAVPKKPVEGKVFDITDLLAK